MLSDQFN